jgi:hypothetical protein
MAPLTSRELATRERIESLIRLMEPGLNLILAAGERVSRMAGADDDWEPPRGPVSGVDPLHTSAARRGHYSDDASATGN